jgi:hypothetical protein
VEKHFCCEAIPHKGGKALLLRSYKSLAFALRKNLYGKSMAHLEKQVYGKSLEDDEEQVCDFGAKLDVVFRIRASPFLSAQSHATI